MTGVKPFSSRYPLLAEEWDSELNAAKMIDLAVFNDKSKCHWQCSVCAFRWEASIGKRKRGQGCPPCGRKKAAANRIITYIEKHGSLKSRFSEIADEWHPTLNGDLDPSKVTPSSNKKAWWLCPNNHSYPQTIDNRTAKGLACSVCSGRRIVEGVNDLATLHPHLIADWAVSNKVDPGSKELRNATSIDWECHECGFTWSATIANRKQGRGCPSCSRRAGSETRRTTRIKAGRSISSMFPGLALEWHPSKNGEMTSSSVTYGSKKKIWWVCSSCSFEWPASPDNRSKGKGCPKCSTTRSRLEEKVLSELNKLTKYEILVNSYPLRDGKKRLQLDLYIPALRLAFEVQDFATHDKFLNNAEGHYQGWSGTKKGPTYHETKRLLAEKSKGITLIDIWEDQIIDGSFKEILKTALSVSDSFIQPL